MHIRTFTQACLLTSVLGAGAVLAGPDTHPETADAAVIPGQAHAVGPFVEETGVAPPDVVTPAPLTKRDWMPGLDTEKGKLSSFFLIGLIANLVLIVVAVAWALRELRRRDRPKPRK